MSDMVQDKEVRNMLMQEKYDRMDWYSYGDEKKEEGWDDANMKNIKNLMDSWISHARYGSLSIRPTCMVDMRQLRCIMEFCHRCTYAPEGGGVL